MTIHINQEQYTCIHPPLHSIYGGAWKINNERVTDKSLRMVLNLRLKEVIRTSIMNFNRA